MRRLRNAMERILTLGGILLILVPVAYLAESWIQMALVVLGILLLEAGMWRTAWYSFMGRREYHKLREEVDEFVQEVRTLNERAEANDRARVQKLQDRLHERVEAIVEAAGEAE